MPTISYKGSGALTASLAAVVRSARTARDLSVSELAQRAGVSRSMIAKVERGEVQPTAALLGRLSGALTMTLTELVARAEGDDQRLVRFDEQPVWTDPSTGYRRRTVSPPAGYRSLQLVEVDLPAGACVSYPTDAYSFVDHQIWVLNGTLNFVEGDTVHYLRAGDCLKLGPPSDCTFINPTKKPSRYLVAVTRHPD